MNNDDYSRSYARWRAWLRSPQGREALRRTSPKQVALEYLGAGLVGLALGILAIMLACW